MKRSVLLKLLWSLFAIAPIFFSKIYAEAPSYSIVFVYLGERLPDYLPITVAQARLFNKDAKIFLVLNSVCLASHVNIIQKLNALNVDFVPCERLESSEPHKRFIERFVVLGIDGYHRYTWTFDKVQVGFAHLIKNSNQQNSDRGNII